MAFDLSSLRDLFSPFKFWMIAYRTALPVSGPVALASKWPIIDSPLNGECSAVHFSHLSPKSSMNLPQRLHNLLLAVFRSFGMDLFLECPVSLSNCC
jgi:hypothetical protein